MLIVIPSSQISSQNPELWALLSPIQRKLICLPRLTFKALSALLSKRLFNLLAMLLASSAGGADFNVPARPSLSLSRGPTSTTVTYRGQTNYQYTIWGSTNCSTWTSLVSAVNSTPQISFSEANRSNRFYKATTLRTAQIYECTLSGADMGSFLIFARTNDTAVLLGSSSMGPGEFANSLSIGTNNRYSGSLMTGRTGFLAFGSNSISGRLTNGLNPSGTISGTLKANNGTYQTSAGLYTGTINPGPPCGGTPVRAILCPDGTIFLESASPADAGSGTMAGTSMAVTLGPAHYTGTLITSGTTRILSGSIAHACGGNDVANFSLTRMEKLF